MILFRTEPQDGKMHTLLLDDNFKLSEFVSSDQGESKSWERDEQPSRDSTVSEQEEALAEWLRQNLAPEAHAVPINHRQYGVNDRGQVEVIFASTRRRATDSEVHEALVKILD